MEMNWIKEKVPGCDVTYEECFNFYGKLQAGEIKQQRIAGNEYKALELFQKGGDIKYLEEEYNIGHNRFLELIELSKQKDLALCADERRIPQLKKRR